MNYFLFRNMFPGFGFFWGFVSNFTAYVSEAIIVFIFNLLRFHGNENSAKNESFSSNFDGFEEKQSLFSGFEEKLNLVNGFEEKQSLVDGNKKKQRIHDGFEGKQSILNGFEEKRSLFDGLEEKQRILDGFVEKQKFFDGLEEKQSILDEFEVKLSIADGFEEKQIIADRAEEKQSDEHVEYGGNRGKDNSFVATCSQYEFLRGKDISGFIEEPKFKRFTLLEFYAEILDETEECIEGAIFELFAEKTKFGDKTEDSVEILEKKTEDSVRSLIAGKTSKNQQTEEVEPEKFEGFDKFMENQEEEEEEGRGDVGLETEESVFPDKENFNSEEEDEDDFDYKQLKTQLQNSRRGGLPTISEESEFSKMVEMEQLQPLKVEEKLEYKDQIAQIQKVYRTYLDKMKKLDILNSQTTHAIGLLSLTNLVGQNPTVQSSTLRVNPHLPKKIWPFKQEKHSNSRAMELVRDLELVYVGQMCLSWEILRWQHDKTLELIQHDPQGIYRYNQVVEEFQLFQVLVHRFLENEPFQCRPRVENYAKNRCVRSIFLQIPVIKGSKGARVKEEDYAYATSSLMLKEVMEESMQVFWEFLRMDKHQINSSSKAPQQRQVAPQDPLDLRLLMNVRGDLEKKEKRVKEMIRCKSCIVKKLQKHQRTPLDHPMFIAQVELKLVSRVLNMSKLSTDHLVWCHEKLEKMKFSGRKLEVQPSILLFPS